MPEYVQIAVNVPQVTSVFDYHLPPALQGQVNSGHLVTVPFGKQTVQGVVLRRIEQPAAPETRPVIQLVDSQPVVTAAQITLAEWLAAQSLTSLAACLNLMLPPGLSKLSDTLYTLIDEKPAQAPASLLSDTQRRLLEELRQRGALRGRQLERALPRRDWRSAAQKLVQMGVLTAQPVLPEPALHPKKKRTVRLICTPQEAEAAMPLLGKKNTPALPRRQLMLRFLLHEAGEVDVAWLHAECAAHGQHATPDDLNALARLNLIAFGEEETYRDPLAGLTPTISQPPPLTQAQAQIWKQVQAHCAAQFGNAHSASIPPLLLHGVTGSGKTEIYLHAVAEVLRQGRQAIVLVPEISLTPQTVRRFVARFAAQVGLIHSKLSEGERYDTWRRARAGAISVVVGARSALFTPFAHLGLIVVDECHDDSYYQAEIPPAYDARQAALAYGRAAGAVCLLGSATPDVASYYRAEQGEWQLLSLPQRILGHRQVLQAQVRHTGGVSRYQPLEEQAETIALPPVEVVDMRQELKAGNRSIFSLRLQSSLASVLQNQQQAILFLNRRGSATYVFCRACGYVLRCPNCLVPLTYHDITWGYEKGASSRDLPLRCHYCKYERKMPKTCPQCGSTQIRQYGAGTQKVEAEVRQMFPQARTLRWDWDTTRQKGAHDALLNFFLNHQADVLIGTQMLAKGLDLPLVTLVGVVLADVGLNLPDYRAGERVFQLLTQVAGRAGRSPLGGAVVLQTFQPDNFVIQAAARHSYPDFYQRELAYRRQLGYPPIANLVRLEQHHTDARKAEENSRQLGAQISAWITESGQSAIEMIGPVPCYFERTARLFRWQIILRGSNPLALLRGRQLKDVLVEVNPPTLL